MFLLVCIVLLCFPQATASGAKEGIKTALEVVIPSVLPFLIIAQGMIYTGMCEKLSAKCAPLFTLLKLNPNAAAPFLASLLAGYPTGCKVVCEMYKDGLIQKEEAEDMLAFVNNGGVIFALNVCGQTAFSSLKSGWAVFAVQIISSLITGMILTSKRKYPQITQKERKLSFLSSFGKSIASGGSVIVNIISAFVVFYALMEAFNIKKIPFLGGLCEITKGIIKAGENNNLPLAAALFSFGGLCVFAQSASFAAEGDLKLHKFFIGKLLSFILSFVLMWIYIKTPYAVA